MTKGIISKIISNGNEGILQVITQRNQSVGFQWKVGLTYIK